MKNPFSKGNSCLNCFSTICGPLPPSFLNLRTIVIPTDNRNMSKTGILNINNADETIHYQHNGNNRYHDYVNSISFLNYFYFVFHFSKQIQRQSLRIPIKIVIHHVIMYNYVRFVLFFVFYYFPLYTCEDFYLLVNNKCAWLCLSIKNKKCASSKNIFHLIYT